jgi:single-strand DNA-binding protein
MRRMAGSVNKVFLVGHVGRDPEIRNTQDGARVANFTLATSETWNDRASGERKERTEWHRVVCFNDRTSDVIEKYVRKGKLVAVEGALQTRKWTDQSGQEKYTTEIVISRFRGELSLLGGRGDSEGGGAGEGGYARERQPARGAAGAGAGAPSWEPPGGGGDLDDEIPF